MRTLAIALTSLTLTVLSVSTAGAITIRIESLPDPSQVGVYLDMEGALGTDGNPLQVELISVGVETDDFALTYLGAEPPPLLPFGAPGVMLNDFFERLTPTPAYGLESSSSDVPPGRTRVLVDYYSPNPTDGYSSFYGTTPENVLLATLNYSDPVCSPDCKLTFGVDQGFYVFDPIADQIIDIQNQVSLANLLCIPEPTTALLVGLGLMGLGVTRRPEV